MQISDCWTGLITSDFVSKGLETWPCSVCESVSSGLCCMERINNPFLVT